MIGVLFVRKYVDKEFTGWGEEGVNFPEED